VPVASRDVAPRTFASYIRIRSGLEIAIRIVNNSFMILEGYKLFISYVSLIADIWCITLTIMIITNAYETLSSFYVN